MARHSFPPVALSELVALLPEARLSGSDRVPVSGITQDSRDVGPGDLYCCIAGDRHDGYDFIPAVAAAGASALLVDRDVDGSGLPMLRVPSVRPALGPVADLLFGHPARTMIMTGVTAPSISNTFT